MINYCVCLIVTTLCICIGFITCLRAWHLSKEHIDPINVIKTQKKITALSELQRQERINEILMRG